MKLLFITNVPSPYRVDFFNELGKFCDLTVTFEKQTSDERDASWKKYEFKNFTGVFLKGKSINTDTAICPDIIRYVGDRSFDNIICSNFSSPTGMIAIEYMRLNRIPYCLECDGGLAKNGKGFKERIKHHFISGAWRYFSTSSEGDRYYMAYGAKQERIVRYPFSSLRDRDILSAPPSLDEKRLLKEKLGIKETNMILAVGQFIPRKGFDVLMNAAALLPEDTGIYFVGGVPIDAYIQQKEELGLHGVHFEGYKSKEELKLYYQAANIFVLPTREDIWGLVINEAMANALPVVSTDRCIAALELICDGVNGYIVPTEDRGALADRIKDLLNDPVLLQQCAEANLEKIKWYTIEKMARRHIEVLEDTV